MVKPEPAKTDAPPCRRLPRVAWCVVLLGVAAACERVPDGDRVETLRGQGMGTEWSVVLVEPESLAKIRAEVQLLLHEHEQRNSTWIDSSEISRLNRTPVGEGFVTSPELMRSLRRSGLMHSATRGAFDPACAPLVRAWGFGPGAGPVEGFEPPDAQRIEHLRQHGRWDNLQINFDTNTVTRRHEAVEIDLSALAKGEGVDAVAEWLLKQRQGTFLIEIGGDLRANGGAPGRNSWPVGIEHPDGSGAMLATVYLRDQSLATSGIYIQRLPEVSGEKGHVRPSHVIDPRSGYPVAHETVSVSVLADTCAEADAWSTALLVLGTEDGLAMAAKHKLPALFVVLSSDQTGDLLVVTTPDFEELMQP